MAYPTPAYNAVDFLNNQINTGTLAPARIDNTLQPPTDYSSILTPQVVSQGLNTPSLPTAYTPKPEQTVMGMPKDAFSSTMAGLAGAVAPMEYDKRGNLINSKLKNVAEMFAKMMQAKQAAGAMIPQTNTGTITPAQLQAILAAIGGQK